MIFDEGVSLKWYSIFSNLNNKLFQLYVSKWYPKDDDSLEVWVGPCEADYGQEVGWQAQQGHGTSVGEGPLTDLGHPSLGDLWEKSENSMPSQTHTEPDTTFRW